MKGTQWVIKTPRLKCRCGATIHMENRGKWRIIYDSPPDTAEERNYQQVIASHRATPTSTLSTPYGNNIDEVSEPPPSAEDDSDG